MTNLVKNIKIRYKKFKTEKLQNNSQINWLKSSMFRKHIYNSMKDTFIFDIYLNKKNIKSHRLFF